MEYFKKILIKARIKKELDEWASTWRREHPTANDDMFNLYSEMRRNELARSYAIAY